MVRAQRRIIPVVVAAMAVSVVHYVDNYSAYDAYPQSDTLPNPSAELIALAWVVFTAFAIAGLIALRTGARRGAAICFAVYSGSGLVGLLHYCVGGTGAFPWWRHAHIVADIALGLAVLACALALVTARGRSGSQAA